MSAEQAGRSPERIAEVSERLLRIFSEQLQIEVPSTETDLMDTGLLDSLSFVSLLLHIEEVFGVQVSIATVELESFATISRIANLLLGL